jgi:hypothetical protein
MDVYIRSQAWSWEMSSPMDQQLCSGKPENGNEQRQRIHTSDKIVNYRSKRYSFRIGPKRCRVDVKLVGSYICF